MKVEAKVHGLMQALCFFEFIVRIRRLSILTWLAPIFPGSCWILGGGNCLLLAAGAGTSCSQHSWGCKNRNL